MKQIAICKVDKNQHEIVTALQRIGASVIHLHMVGDGCPDLLVGFRGETHLLEVKGKRGRLTPAQRVLHATWCGQKIAIVRSIDDALKAVGII